jgi:hypothetical protein
MGQFDSIDGRDELAAALQDPKTNAALKERREQLRDENKRLIGNDRKDPDPDLFSDRKVAQHNGQWS